MKQILQNITFYKIIYIYISFRKLPLYKIHCLFLRYFRLTLCHFINALYRYKKCMYIINTNKNVFFYIYNLSHIVVRLISSTESTSIYFFIRHRFFYLYPFPEGPAFEDSTCCCNVWTCLDNCCICLSSLSLSFFIWSITMLYLPSTTDRRDSMLVSISCTLPADSSFMELISTVRRSDWDLLVSM